MSWGFVGGSRHAIACWSKFDPPTFDGFPSACGTTTHTTTGGFKVKLDDKKGKPIAAGTISTKATRRVI